MKKNRLFTLLLVGFACLAFALFFNKQLPITGADFETEHVGLVNELKIPIADVSIIEDDKEKEDDPIPKDDYKINYEGVIDKQAAIKNKGTVPVMVRAMVLLQLRDWADNILVGGRGKDEDLHILDQSIVLLPPEEEVDYIWKADDKGYYYLVEKDSGGNPTDEYYQLVPGQTAELMQAVKIIKFQEFHESGALVKIGDQTYDVDQMHFSIQVVVDALQYDSDLKFNYWRRVE